MLMSGYRFVNLEQGEVALYRVDDQGALAERPLLRGTPAEMERELGLWPGTLRKVGRVKFEWTTVEVAFFVLGVAAGFVVCWGLG